MARDDDASGRGEKASDDWKTGPEASADPTAQTAQELQALPPCLTEPLLSDVPLACPAQWSPAAASIAMPDTWLVS